ncbi:MAG: lipoate--protein ligase [Oscillospiraceae bacterium]|nr:lipoate--protein ligase [Oscillospiraceae bacterium]
MNLIINQSHNPAFNLALEEYLLESTELDLIMLWRNSKAVIIGNNQNAVEEIDADYVREREIAVVRRQSGGGAVFHDLGNINFTIIHQNGVDDQSFGGYRAFTAPVCGYLETLGVKAEFSGRNDLVIDGKKFCGNAQALKKNRIMHHGCILFDADFTDLAGALKPKAEKIESKGIKSVRSRVTNVGTHLGSPMTPEAFMDGLADYFRANVEGIRDYALTAGDITGAQALADEKHARWEWNFGKSPPYNWENSGRYPFGGVDVRLNVKAGVIEQAHLFGDFFGMADKSELEAALCGIPHRRGALESALAQRDIGRYIQGMTRAELLDLLY